MVFIFALILQAQTIVVDKPEGPPEPSPAALERIRRAIGRPGFEIIKDPDAPVFRVYIREHLPPSEKLWKDETLTPLYVRTRAPLFHHEFLESVTPEDFRAATLYPIGVDVIPIANTLIKAVGKELRARAESKARKAIAEELRLLLESREKSGVDR